MKRSEKSVRGLMLAIILACCECFCVRAAQNRKPAATPGGSARLTPEQVNELEMAADSFADRFVTILADACDKVIEDNPSREARRYAIFIKLHFASSAYSIA